MKRSRSKRAPLLPTVTRWRSDNELQAAFGLATLLALVLISIVVYALVSPPKAQASAAENLFYSLHTPAGRGLFDFLSAKEQLRASLSDELKSQQTPSNRNTLRRIAVYLFPELLSADDFEKNEAFEIWKPVVLKLEDTNNPKSKATSFELLRTLIWEYENPSRVSPTLSQTATQFLRIYETLTSAEATSR